MRVAQILLWLVVVLMLVRPLFRGRQISRGPVARDEIVKDPVCQTYVVRSRAVSRSVVSGPTYFCSAECARRYVAGV